MREIGRFNAEIAENMWHLTPEIQCFPVGFFQVNSKIVERYDGIIGEAAIPLGCGDFILLIDSSFSYLICFTREAGNIRY